MNTIFKPVTIFVFVFIFTLRSNTFLVVDKEKKKLVILISAVYILNVCIVYIVVVICSTYVCKIDRHQRKF